MGPIYHKADIEAINISWSKLKTSEEKMDFITERKKFVTQRRKVSASSTIASGAPSDTLVDAV